MLAVDKFQETKDGEQFLGGLREYWKDFPMMTAEQLQYVVWAINYGARSGWNSGYQAGRKG